MSNRGHSPPIRGAFLADRELSGGGKDYSGDYRFIRLYVEQDGRCRLLLCKTTFIPPCPVTAFKGQINAGCAVECRVRDGPPIDAGTRLRAATHSFGKTAFRRACYSARCSEQSFSQELGQAGRRRQDVVERERLLRISEGGLLTNTSTLFDLTGRVAVVTGGNGGIGRGIAIGLAEAGAAVAVFGRNDEKNQRVLSELKAIGVPSIALNVDVTNRAGLEPALRIVESELGGIDILVNNAGNVSLSGGVLQETPEDWDNVIETQLNAVFLLSKLAARSMVSRRGGKIINLGSMYSFFGSGLVPSYSAAKGAVVQLTKSMAIELAPHNIQVNAIAPGWIETDMTAPVRTMPMNDEILARTPCGRWGQATEVAGTAVYLASRASDFVTGATIRVDGGYSIR